MKFNKHLDIIDKHAFLGASKYQWLNYDEERLAQMYKANEAKKHGTIVHNFAAQAIQLGQKLPRSRITLNMYVNDAISFKMTPEQPLFYSYNCFGTADAISFRRNELRIHDLKTGVTPAKMDQLAIYAALFCLEYDVKPEDISIVLAIYQSNEIIEDKPEATYIRFIMDKIVEYDKIIDNLKEQGV